MPPVRSILLACAVRRPGGRAGAGDADGRQREQPRHAPHAAASETFTAENPDIALVWVLMEKASCARPSAPTSPWAAAASTF
jgi:hypothetical protein